MLPNLASTRVSMVLRSQFRVTLYPFVVPELQLCQGSIRFSGQEGDNVRCVRSMNTSSNPFPDLADV